MATTYMPPEWVVVVEPRGPAPSKDGNNNRGDRARLIGHGRSDRPRFCVGSSASEILRGKSAQERCADQRRTVVSRRTSVRRLCHDTGDCRAMGRIVYLMPLATSRNVRRGRRPGVNGGCEPCTPGLLGLGGESFWRGRIRLIHPVQRRIVIAVTKFFELGGISRYREVFPGS